MKNVIIRKGDLVSCKKQYGIVVDTKNWYLSEDNIDVAFNCLGKISTIIDKSEVKLVLRREKIGNNWWKFLNIKINNVKQIKELIK